MGFESFADETPEPYVLLQALEEIMLLWVLSSSAVACPEKDVLIICGGLNDPCMCRVTFEMQRSKKSTL